MAANAQILARLDKAISRLDVVNDKLGGRSGAASKTQHAKEDLEKLVVRLEAAANTLERSRVKVRPSTTDSEISAIQAFDQILNGKLAKFFQLSDELGGDVAKQAVIVKQAFHAQRAFLVWVSGNARQPQTVITAKLKDTSEAISAVQDIHAKNRGSKMFNHLSSVSEGIAALGWVIAAGKPCTFVKEKSNAAQFYTNRVLKDTKDKDPKTAEWARGFVGVLKDLEEYTRDQHPLSLKWGH